MTAPAYVPSFVEELPRRFADFLTARTGRAAPELWLGAALASQQTLQGGVCLDLREFAGRAWPDDEASAEVHAPALPDWLEALRASDAVGRPGDVTPLVLTDAGRLYLHRYWEYEDSVARDLLQRAAHRPPGVDVQALAGAWAVLSSRTGLSEGQRVAAVTAALRGLAVISGGAGTGKTTIVACLLKLLTSQSDPARPLRVRLAAPTGKAAGRLKEQLRECRDTIDPERAIDAIMRDEPATLHRLLGGTRTSTRFRHGAGNPLPLDALVIDETSMVDLAMMAKVVAALPSSARLILIGDKDQLPPVGVGSVFGELCRAPADPPPDLRAQIEAITGIPPAVTDQAPVPSDGLAGSVTLLRHSFRFEKDSGIGRLADAIRSADGAALAGLFEHPPSDLTWLPAEPAGPRHATAELLGRVTHGFAAFLESVRTGADPADVLRGFNEFRVLCVLRDGPDGVSEWNARIEAHLRNRRRIPAGQTWYEGRPVLVTRNDYAQRLWNGDIGIALRHEDGRLRVHFEGADGAIRDFPPGRLSHVETAYALTIHKSQGSEFGHVLLAMPRGDSRLLGRELLYTGVTRARRRLDILGDPKRFADGMQARLPHASGLAEALGMKPAQARQEPAQKRGCAAGPVQGELF